MQKNDFHFVANCAAGLEKMTGDEVLTYGGVIEEISTGVVRWRGTLETAYRACLWSRYSSKVLLVIKTFPMNNADDLYEESLSFNWLDHFTREMSFSVSSTLANNPAVTHSHYASLRVKDGIVDHFRKNGQERPNVKKDRADFRVHIHVDGAVGSLYVDLSGDSLHRRGYREATGVAPLKETLAAALVTLSGWSSSVSADTAFVDPMCGSGTILIEAALIWGDSAPGLSRNYFGFNKWLGHDAKVWSSLVDEAVLREEEAFEKKWPVFIGYDCDPEVVAVARKNIEKAGLESKITVKAKEIAHLKPPSQKGYLISNLPYGERLSEKEEIGYLYGGVGKVLQRYFQGWNTGLLIGETDFADKLGIDTGTSYRLNNGPLVCRFFVGKVKFFEQPGVDVNTDLSGAINEGADFYNRLLKNIRKIKPWADKNEISCFRVYDRDLPDYNVAIDVYERWVLVQEYAPPKQVDSELARKRFSLVLSIVRQALNLKRDRVFVKQRKRQKGKEQYEKKNVKQKFHEVFEGDCCFLVNFTNYLDTGLFLDHRPLRQKIADISKGKRFLNLFGYTGSATVHAARGGAVRTTTVDLSATYLDWARKNLALNGLNMKNHIVVKQDCLSWLKETRSIYDIIFIDPPTFSNTKKKNRIFDIQKNHTELIYLASQHLDKAGIILFSTNFRGFTLSKTIEDDFKVRNISKETIPFDFRRNKSIHMCWEISKKARKS